MIFERSQKSEKKKAMFNNLIVRERNGVHTSSTDSVVEKGVLPVETQNHNSYPPTAKVAVPETVFFNIKWRLVLLIGLVITGYILFSWYYANQWRKDIDSLRRTVKLFQSQVSGVVRDDYKNS